MLSAITGSRFDRSKLALWADVLAVLVAISLPWSTSATSILVAVWVLALVPTLKFGDVTRELTTPEGVLPVILVLLGVLGMLWSNADLHQKFGGLSSFVKLLAIPLLMAQFRRSANAAPVFIGFLGACIVLMLASFAVKAFPSLPKNDAGAIVKTYIVQSIEFTICAAVLLHISCERALQQRLVAAGLYAAVAFAFLASLVLVVTSRTALAIIPALMIAYGGRRFGWRGLLAGVVIAAIAGAIVLAVSPYIRDRVTGIWIEKQQNEMENIPTSSGSRIEFWSKSLTFIADAPVVGHGTGSIVGLFRAASVGQTGARALISTNPHNQTFAVAIQLGIVGAVLLWAMWLSHFALFRGSGTVAWIGLVIVVQNVTGSLFNSFLFDFGEGWIYVFGVGVAAGAIRRQSSDRLP